MELFFLACFVFGLLFTVVSFALGSLHSALHAGDSIAGPAAEAGDMPHLHGHVELPHLPGDAGSATVPDATAYGETGPHVHHGPSGHGTLPILNFSSLVVFLTWFGAAGYVLLVFAGAALAVAIAGAVVVGAVGAFLVALFLERVLAGERIMNPRDYRIEGTIARVTVSIPSNGVGEIVFDKAGSRRSEAARSLDGRAIPRDTEVVVIRYERGVAAVEPWETIVGQRRGTDTAPEPQHQAPGR